MNVSILLIHNWLWAFSLLFFLGKSTTNGQVSSQSVQETPYFGNGFHNGWADQNSVVIWTRLTKSREMNLTGPDFLVPTAEEHRNLRREKNQNRLTQIQMPQGMTIEQMQGALPGAAGEVQLTYSPINEPGRKQILRWTRVDTSRNYTKQWKLTGLQANTAYQIQLEARPLIGKGKRQALASDKITGTFQTPADNQTVRPVTFCIVSCHDYSRRDTLGGHKIYSAMTRDKPNFYVHTGDIEYYDQPGPYALTEEMMRFKWNRLFALPLQRQFWTQTTTYFQKDDHDVLSDDTFPGTTYGAVSFERGIEIFDKEQFPTHTPTYKTVRWGQDLQIWLLEGRNYRSENMAPDGKTKTVLGEQQKAWLMKSLDESTATFKLIITPTPILGPDRGGKNDNLANKGFMYEGDEIRAFLKDRKNVFICTGDRHWQYVTHHANTQLWEFGCGAGSDSHAGGWYQSNAHPQHRFLRIKGGYLFGEVTRGADGKSRLRLTHRDVDGQAVHQEEFTQTN